MKLYFSPGACSLSPHIALREAGLAFDLVKVDLQQKTTADGQDFGLINPKGYVPVLVLDDGEVLSEGPAIVQYIADRAPDSKLAPPIGSMARYHLMEWLNFITSELHKSYTPLFNPRASEELKSEVRTNLTQRFDYLVRCLQESPYLMGEAYTVADGYLFTVLSWSRLVQVDLAPWPILQNYLERISKRDSVRAAMRAEGIIK